MTRVPKNYSDDVKADIYKPLSGGPMGFKQLKKASGKAAPTLSAYLHRGEDLGEVEHEGKRKPYALTAKGGNELDRIIIERKMREQPVRFRDRVDSVGELNANSLDEPNANFILAGELRNMASKLELPFPIPVDAVVYASEELAFVFDQAQAIADVVGHDYVSERKAHQVVLKDTIQSYAKQFVWSNILERLWMLMEWHGSYRENPKAEKRGMPPPVTAENLLRFNASLRISYEFESIKELGEVYLAERRLVGALLLQLALGSFKATPYASSFDLIPLLERGHLLSREDAKRIRRVLPKWLVHRSSDRTTLEYHIRLRGFSKVTRRVILEVAFRYLREGQVLQIPKGMTAKTLAESVSSLVEGRDESIHASEVSGGKPPAPDIRVGLEL